MSKPVSHSGESPSVGCPVERALEIVGGKWTLLILHELMAGPRRFTDLQRGRGTASPKVLTERLREMEQAGLLTRTAYAEVPPRVEYALTPQGHALQPIMRALLEWGETLPPKADAA
jgi:DNA-binding HxlR family transcriptional regulator